MTDALSRLTVALSACYAIERELGSGGMATVYLARDLKHDLVRQGTVLASLGIVTGIGVGLGVTRGLSRFLFGVSPFDPTTFGVVAGALLVAGLAALGARRARF